LHVGATDVSYMGCPGMLWKLKARVYKQLRIWADFCG